MKDSLISDNDEEKSNYVTIKTLLTILLVIVFAATSLIVADTRLGVQTSMAKIEKLQTDKLDKELYYRDMSIIRETLLRMESKLDSFKR
jgi:hypothetical protein